jgi:hypothetical protein
MSLDSCRLHCISAAPAALDRYLAAVPAMSLIPFAPFARHGGQAEHGVFASTAF